MSDFSLSSEPRLQVGTPESRRAVRALFYGGFATFSTLYGMQPLMPMLSAQYHLSPAAASGVISTATATLALMLIPAALLSDRWGRKPLMCGALALAVLCSVACLVPVSYAHLLILRTLTGLFLAGLPAVAMTYIGEETDPRSLSRIMGIYVGGTAFGGMAGRFIAGIVSDYWGWRWAIAVLAVIAIYMTFEFWRNLPASRHFRPTRHSLRTLLPSLARNARLHLSDPILRGLFALSFLLMGSFVSLYNYLSYHLLDAPFHLRQSVVGTIFLLYLVGVAASMLTGRLIGRFGRRNMLLGTILTMGLGLGLTASLVLPLVICGIGLFTFGFFGAHATASSWVSHRAVRARALATALYLCCYYLGSSLVGWFSGLMWAAGGWHGVAATLGLLLLICLGVGWRLGAIARREG